MDTKKKQRRSIPVLNKAKPPKYNYGPSNVENRIRKHSETTSEKSPTGTEPSTCSNPVKSTLSVKGPFNPAIVAKFNKSDKEPPRPRIRSSSEVRKRPDHKPSTKTQDDLDLHRNQLKPAHHVLKEHTNVSRPPVKRITRRRSAEDEARLEELEVEKDVLTRNMQAMKDRLGQYESVMKTMKVDPTSLKELLLNEEAISKERAEAAKSADELKDLLATNIEISTMINERAQEIQMLLDN